MQCQINYDECYSTRLFWMTGQNSAEHSGHVDDAFMAEFAPISWFEENLDNSIGNVKQFRDFEQNG